MASDPHNTPTTSFHVDVFDQTSQNVSVSEHGAGDFINPDFEFDQFETELAMTSGRYFFMCW